MAYAFQIYFDFSGYTDMARGCAKLFGYDLPENFRLPYLTVTPVFSICPKHGYLNGEHDFCPLCDQELLEGKGGREQGAEGRKAPEIEIASH